MKDLLRFIKRWKFTLSAVAVVAIVVYLDFIWNGAIGR